MENRYKPTKEQTDDYLNKLVAKFKKDPKWELQQEFGKMLMRHINTFTPDELARYNELKELLAP